MITDGLKVKIVYLFDNKVVVCLYKLPYFYELNFIDRFMFYFIFITL